MAKKSKKLPLKKKNSVRVRIAPSPTGPLHIGTARTALFNYLFARRNQGNFILRIEDTDLERSDIKWEKDILDNLQWLDILWDEGPLLEEKGRGYTGDYGPYRQSERGEIYERHIKRLFNEGFLYWCFCKEEELEAQRQEQMARGVAPKYTGHCRNLDEKEIKEYKREGRKGILRFKVPHETIRVNDLIRGKLELDTSILGDIAVARDFKTPFYNLAVVIDDFEMKISHVIRGEDHVSNTPKQILFQEALNFPRPEYAHLPLILGSDRSKLSKRHGAVSIGEYRKKGYLPGALVNFMAFLGWNPGTEEEIFSLDNLVNQFSLERVQKGGAVFSNARLDWINGYYIRKIPLGELTEEALPYLFKKYISKTKEKSYKVKETGEIISFNDIKKIIGLFQERVKKLCEIEEDADFFFKDKISFDKKMLIWKNMTMEEIHKNLEKCYKILEGVDKSDWRLLTIRDLLIKEADKGEDRGYLLWPLRVALTGKKGSPPPFEIIEILGREKTLKRIKEAIT